MSSSFGARASRQRGKVTIQDRHEVEIKLGASYPRSMPEIRWLTPIYHPNISEIGMVCLGGYGTHWVPSLNLDEPLRHALGHGAVHNYDIRSPYNREAALRVANQTSFLFPLDARPLRDLRAALGRVEAQSTEDPAGSRGTPRLPPRRKPVATPNSSENSPPTSIRFALRARVLGPGPKTMGVRRRDRDPRPRSRPSPGPRSSASRR